MKSYWAAPVSEPSVEVEKEWKVGLVLQRGLERCSAYPHRARCELQEWLEHWQLGRAGGRGSGCEICGRQDEECVWCTSCDVKACYRCSQLVSPGEAACGRCLRDLPRSGRAGGKTRRPKKVKLIPAEEGLVNLEHKPYEDIENGPRKPMVGGPKFQQERVSTKLEVILDKIGRGTALGYSGAWRQWALFCKARRRDPYFLGETRAERHADEEILLEFVVHLLVLFNRTEGALKGKLLAIRFRHLLEGLEDPLKGNSRLWMALGGIKRRMGKPKRKWPVILKMLVRIWQRFALSDNKDEVVLACAAVTAWFFLLRSGDT